MRLKLERELAEFEKIKLNLQIKTGGHRQQKISKKFFITKPIINVN